MERDGQRHCDVCGQPIPKMSKLAVQTEGKDVCLACQIREAESRNRRVAGLDSGSGPPHGKN